MPPPAKRKITWITPDYFVDCDFNPEILAKILQEYSIHWIILLPTLNARFSENDFAELKKMAGLTIDFIYSSYRQRDPRRLLYYKRIYSTIQRHKPDIAYLNCVPDPYFLPFIWLLNKRRSIFCAHDGGVHAGFDFKLITNLAFKLSYKFARYVCMFSASQASLFRTNFPKTRVFEIPLALKSFGESISHRSGDKITFLSFGVINYSKHIDLLIDAACNIYDKGYRNFQVSINGNCADWSFYQSKMRYPELFHCNIRIIENAEIPDLFNTAHYFVQPYRHVSQSGAMKVAFYYQVPVLATDFPGFSDEIREGVNGYLFKPSDVHDLERLMMQVLDSHKKDYPQLLHRMAEYTRQQYASEVLAQKYLTMFNEVADAAG